MATKEEIERLYEIKREFKESYRTVLSLISRALAEAKIENELSDTEEKNTNVDTCIGEVITPHRYIVIPETDLYPRRLVCDRCGKVKDV